MRPNFARLQQAIGVLLLCFSLSVQAQMKVGQPAGSPNPSAALDVSGGPYSTGSPYRGIAPPKVALTQTTLATPISNPVTGLLVYNTTKAGDVTPGYYYWEDTHWVRFNTNANTGARVATAGGGQSIPAYTLSEVRNLTSIPDNLILVESDREGLFRYDPNDTTTPDDNGIVLVTTATSNPGKRYKRVIESAVNLKWFGAKGDGTTDDTQAVQNAINYVKKAASLPSILPFYSGNPGTLLVPVGTFKVGTLNVNGSIRLIGQGGGTYAGSYFLQKDEGTPVILLGPDIDNSSNSTVIENICFKSAARDPHPTNAVIKTQSGINSNSVYIRNCWFQNSDNCAIWLTQGDDIQITGCTFDVLPFSAIRLGTIGGGIVANARITNNTFFQISTDHIKIDNAKDIIIANNSAYNVGDVAHGIPDEIPTARFINTAATTTAQNIIIKGNVLENIPHFCQLETIANGVVISGNTTKNISPNSFVWVTGGGTATNVTVTGNSAYATGTWANSPISCIGSGLQNSIITSNTFFAGSSTALGLNFPDGRTGNNIIDKNIFTNFVATDNLLNPFANGKTIATPTEIGIPTKDWTTSVYHELYAPNTLTAGKVYLLKLKIGKNGVDAVTAIYCVPIEITYAGQTQPGDLAQLNFAAYSGTRTGFKVRLKKLASGGCTYGIEATINDVALEDGTLTYSLTPLL